MSEWLSIDSALKVIPIAATSLGVLKSWRNHWKGPRSLARFFHLSARLVLMTQDRDYYKATCDELIERINQNAALTDFLDSLPDSDAPKVLPIQTLHPRSPSTTPVTRSRLRKRKPNSIEAPKP
jgi:hypothetical protein